MTHTHRGAGARVPIVVWWVTVAIAAGTLLGAVILWPRGEAPDLGPTGADLERVNATVLSVGKGQCTDLDEGLPTECQSVDVKITSGSTNGHKAHLDIPETDFNVPALDKGDQIILTLNEFAPEEFRYSFADFQRGRALIVVVVIFGAAVILFARMQGVRALAGLALSLAVVLGFLLPSLLRDNNAIAVALVAASMVAFAALYVTHGVNLSTTIALLGTLASLLAITLLSALFVSAADLTGLADESGQILSLTAEALDPRGVLLAGIVIGALGVLDDVTVTQVAAVQELHLSNPEQPRFDLYRGALRIGRDHISSTVNTLVLAYVGAFAEMLFFYQQGQALSAVATGEIVAAEVIRALVGSIGLVLSVPLTTGLAVLAVSQNSGEGDLGHSRFSQFLRARLPSSDRPKPRARGERVRADWSDFTPDDDLHL